jgi:AcrR family transcriptional regulator
MMSFERPARGRPPTPFLRERILASASRLFANTDFNSVTVDEVAAHAHVGKGSVYRQFNSKEGLYASVMIGAFIQLQEEIRVALKTSASIDDQIYTIVAHAVNFFWTRQQFFELLRDRRLAPRKLLRHYRAERAKLLLLICDVLRAAADRGAMRPGLDIKLAAEALMGLVRGLCRHSRDYSVPAVAARTIVTIFLGGCFRTKEDGTQAAWRSREDAKVGALTSGAYRAGANIAG